MKIYIDGDAIPKAVKDILFKRAKTKKNSYIFVSNSVHHLPKEIHQITVDQGLDSADDKIIELVSLGDLVITADIPLAHRVIKNRALALNPRGTLYTEDNIGSILSMRNAMTEIREIYSYQVGGPPPMSKKDVKTFSDKLNAILQKSSFTV